ncbi:MAG: tyrosine-type recombinase/integrase, partial [Oscillospiraceae bacterium]
RKVSALRTFYKYLTVKSNLLENNPVKELEIPSLKKSLPKYLSLNESVTLLENVSSSNKIRDFCILTLFLNCGMRLSELVGINLEDIKDNTLKLLGKGNKERIIYLNEQCINTIEEYSKIRPKDTKEKNALFISKKGARLSKRRVQEIVTYNLEANGLNGYSTHKLRHTAATLLYQYGNVDINILKELLGHENLGTTQIYTHISNKQLEDASLKSPLKSVKSPKNQK